MNKYLVLYEITNQSDDVYKETQIITKMDEFDESDLNLFERKMKENLLRKYNEECRVKILAFSKFGE